ncbi:amidohydrolase [Natronococcus pandeyae]|uniref:Amidohydrolase n=1 Tax=Natronococcus pandeyae TaxID=2055836 RepID=A0A8J8PYR5_9EURY|nr:iron-sulfur cluster assembly protein [Natronococcus pandeyae]TYL37331.1 amidohydrolase [Natronococcus pandeyae]
MSIESNAEIVQRLDDVLDPCSCMTDNPVSIVELGLVEEIERDDETVRIELLPTTPMCMYMTQIIDEAEAEVVKIDGIEDVDVSQNVEDMWRPERMSDELRQAKEEQFGSQLREGPDSSEPVSHS